MVVADWLKRATNLCAHCAYQTAWIVDPKRNIRRTYLSRQRRCSRLVLIMITREPRTSYVCSHSNRLKTYLISDEMIRTRMVNLARQVFHKHSFQGSSALPDGGKQRRAVEDKLSVLLLLRNMFSRANASCFVRPAYLAHVFIAPSALCI